MKKILFLVLFMAQSALAQVPSNVLNPTQCATFKANIMSDSSLDIPRINRQDDVIRDAYNAPASPAYWVFRYDLAKGEMLFTKSVDNTGFAFTANGYIGRSQGERDAFALVFDQTNKTNCGLPNVIQAFKDIFSGTGAEAINNRAHVDAICRKQASRAEKLFANTTGCTGGTGASPNGPCVMTFVGPMATTHVACALNLP